MAVFSRNKHTKTKEQIAAMNVDDHTLSVQLKKPNANEWVRAYGESLDDLDFVKLTEQQDDTGEWRQYIIQGKDEETEKRICEICQPIKCALLVPMVNSFEKFFIWVCKQPGPNMRNMESHISAKRAVEFAQKQWVKIYWDSPNKVYQAKSPIELEGFPKPKWPSQSIEELVTIAFEDNLIIEDIDHKVVQRAKSKAISSE
jgi:hypothetical protein